MILPSIQASGLWSLKPPYQYLLTNEVWYTCIAIRRIEDLNRLGIDVLQDYYLSKSLTKEDYLKDLAAGVCIITVRDNASIAFSFPSSYLSSFPAGGGVAYQVLALAIELGALPTTLDLSVLQQQLANLVKAELGVTREARLVNLSTTELLDRETHLRLEAERKRVADTVVLPEVKVKQLTTENLALKARITELENYILTNN